MPRPVVDGAGWFRIRRVNQCHSWTSGGAEGNRTPDLLIANEALSQLSYSPVPLGGPDNADGARGCQVGFRRSCGAPGASLASADLGGQTVAPGLISGIFGLIFVLIRLYTWAIILAAVFSMLISFGVLDTRNRIVWSIGDFLNRITEPALRPIRNILPNLGGIDISPLILLLLLQFILVPVVAALQRGLLYGSWDLLLS